MGGDTAEGGASDVDWGPPPVTHLSRSAASEGSVPAVQTLAIAGFATALQSGARDARMDRSRGGGKDAGGGLSGGKKTAFVQRPGLGALLQRGQPQQQQQQSWSQNGAAAAREDRRNRLQSAPGEQQPSLAQVQQEQVREEPRPRLTPRQQQAPIRDLGTQRQPEPQQSREEQERNARLEARERGPAHLRGGNQGGQVHRGERPSSASADGGRGRGGRQEWRSRPASAGPDNYGGGSTGGRYSERDQFGGRPGGRGGRGGFGGGRGGARGGGFDRRDVVVKSAKEFGVIALLKEDKGFGFIKSPAVVENLFFHVSRLVSQRDWPSERVSVGDECQFELVADRSGNLSADMIRSAPEGSAVFERINATGVTGTITKDLRNVRSPFAGRNNSGAVDKFEGRVQYTPEGTEQATEIEFGFADIDSINAQLWEGDEVTFDVVDDLRFKKQIASNFALVKCSPAERTTGIVDKVADGFGFVECAERNARLFFHFKEILLDEHSEHGGIRARSEIEFNVTTNHQQGKDKEIAIRVVSLPRGSVKFEELVAQQVPGKVVKVECVSARQAQQNRQQQSRFSNRPRATTQGEIVVSGDGDEKLVVPFIGKNVRFDQILKSGDEVQLDVMLDKRSQQRYALNIVLQTPAAEGREQGIIESIKDTFGFIDAFGEYRKIFFHQSNVLRGIDGKIIEVDPGTEVEFDVDVSGTSNRDGGDPRGQHSQHGQQQHEKANALRITVLPPGTIQMVTEIKTRQTGFVGREAQPPGSVRRDGERNGKRDGKRDGERNGKRDDERNGKINFNELPDGTRPYAVYGLADIAGSAEALEAEAKARQAYNLSDNQPEPEPEPVCKDDLQTSSSVKVVEVSLVSEKSSISSAVPPIRKGEEVVCDILLDKRDPGHRFAGRISVVWTTGVVKSAPRATGGFGQVSAPDRDLQDLKFHWTEQLDEEDRIVSLARKRFVLGMNLFFCISIMAV